MGECKTLSIRELKDCKPVKIVQREIYLTFDDGIQAGTEEVLQVLRDTGVKGTFFLTGIHLYYFIEKSKDRKKAFPSSLVLKVTSLPFLKTVI